MSNWKEYKFSNIVEINPTESLKKGTIAKKIGMDILQPFNRAIPSYTLEAFSGGTKFKNGDTIMARITPCLENGKTSMIDILDEDEITINNNIDPICKVWHSNKCIGVIINTTALDDFLVQLKRKFDAGEDVSDYYIEYYQKSSRETFKLHIDTEYFTIDNAPEGFYDHIDSCMKELSGF